MAVANHCCHSSKPRQFFRSALRIASRYNDASLRILLVRAPDKCPRSPICFSGHAAGIHHHHIGVRCLAFVQPGGKQMAGHGLAIGARRAAPEMFNVKLPHTSSLFALFASAGNWRTASKGVIRYTVD